MKTINAIAQVLNVSENQIKSIATWDKVYFVQFTVGRPTFVSKRAIAPLLPFTFELRADRNGKKPWVAQIVGKSDRYGFERAFVEPVSIEWAGRKGCKSATFALTETGYYQDSDSGYYRVFRNDDGFLTYAEASYDEVRHMISQPLPALVCC